ncbi:MAG: hypothetical protein JWQ35_2191 [Bacteriovoracaceae bacterium]|nr:hypothetical protein [Bacteriovoracaceae bacterium]
MKAFKSFWGGTHFALSRGMKLLFSMLILMALLSGCGSDNGNCESFEAVASRNMITQGSEENIVKRSTQITGSPSPTPRASPTPTPVAATSSSAPGATTSSGCSTATSTPTGSCTVDQFTGACN